MFLSWRGQRLLLSCLSAFSSCRSAVARLPWPVMNGLGDGRALDALLGSTSCRRPLTLLSGCPSGTSGIRSSPGGLLFGSGSRDTALKSMGARAVAERLMMLGRKTIFQDGVSCWGMPRLFPFCCSPPPDDAMLSACCLRGMVLSAARREAADGIGVFDSGMALKG